MLRRVQKYIRNYDLLSRNGRVLVCVSGGADSMALWDVLQRGGYDCVVAHCNFHLRGEESDRDEQAVSHSPLLQPRDDVHTPLFIKHFDTRMYAQGQHISIEMAARELRYRWFAELAQEQRCEAIAVAHHQNDQAETVLLNLRRGAGLRGLCGMRPKSGNPVVTDSVPVIRPLLCTTRDYIEHYLRDIRHINWVTDSTNSDTNILRNAIRKQLCCHSKAEIEHIAATAERMQGYVDWLEKRDTRQAEMTKLYEELRSYHFPQTDEIYEALQRGEGGKVFYSPTHQATIKKGKLCVTTVS